MGKLASWLEVCSLSVDVAAVVAVATAKLAKLGLCGV